MESRGQKKKIPFIHSTHLFMWLPGRYDLFVCVFFVCLEDVHYNPQLFLIHFDANGLFIWYVRLCSLSPELWMLDCLRCLLLSLKYFVQFLAIEIRFIASVLWSWHYDASVVQKPFARWILCICQNSRSQATVRVHVLRDAHLRLATLRCWI